MVAVVMMVMRDHSAIHVSTGKCGSGECDCGKDRDKFDLVHGVVPFFILVQAHSCAYTETGRSAGSF